MPELPDLAQVDQLPAELQTVVGPELEDSNGHMNIKHYFALQAKAVAGLFERIGYVLAPHGPRVGPFTLEQHLRYHHEVLVGHELSAHLRLVDRSEKLVHGLAFLLDRTQGRVANTLEFVIGNVDLDTRRLTPFSVAAAEVLDRELDAHRGLDWEVPRFAPLGLRQGVRG